MKPLFIIVIAIIVIGGGYLLLQNDADQSLNTNTVLTEMDTSEIVMEDDMHDTNHMDTSSQEAEVTIETTNTEIIEPIDDVVIETNVNSQNTAININNSAKEFTVDSYSFGYSLKEIRVNEGDTVTINLTNSAGLHDLVIDEFNVATEKIRQGENDSVTFVATKAGSYEFYCSVGNHRAQGMVGKLIVE
jgi:plastocyanin